MIINAILLQNLAILILHRSNQLHIIATITLYIAVLVDFKTESHQLSH
jgi:hypothetical protein